MSTKVLHLPDFLGLLPKKTSGSINPHFKEAGSDLNTWAKKTFGSLYTKSITWSETPLLCALTYPLASRQVLYASMLYVLAVFILDDITDDTSSSEVRSITQSWINTLRECEGVEGVDHPLLESMRSEVVPPVKAIIGPFHWPQLIATSEDYANHVVHEALAREAFTRKLRVPNDIQSYLRLRRQTAGTRFCFVFTRSSCYLYIPDEIMAHPVVRDMENYALDLVTIVNDVYSFKKEYEQEGVLSNILASLESDPETAHLDLQERIDYTTKLFISILDRFQECRNKLSSFDPDQQEQLRLLADGMMDWVVGSTEWSRACRRYHVFVNETDRRNNILRLELDQPSRPSFQFQSLL